MIVAIDGPAGSGKSTVARALARKRGLAYLDTGAMYRCVTLACLEEAVDICDKDAVADIASISNISFVPDPTSTLIMLNGRDVTREIRTPRVDKNVSRVAAIPEVRASMVNLQRKLGAEGNVVAEGRDIGTVVFPHADVKIFLIAQPEARAHRRAVQQAGGDVAKNKQVEVCADTEAEILADLKRRDKIDSSRKTAPLKPAEDAHFMDSSLMSVEEEVEAICRLMDEVESCGKGNDLDTGHPSKKDGKKEELHKKAELHAQAVKTKVEAKQESSALHQKVQGTRRSSRKRQAKKLEPMKMFGNSFTDYEEHPMSDYPWHARLVVKLMGCLVWLYTKILWPWKIEDVDKLYKASSNKGVVVVMNHGSMLDPLPMVLAMLFHGRHLRPVYKAEFRSLRISAWFFTHIGGIPVKRDTADLKAIRRAQRALEAGDSILIFPEGTRVKEGETSQIHGGFALMAQLAGAQVVPAAIVGARDITPRGKHLGRPGRVFLKVGDALSFDDLEATTRKTKLAEMEKVAMDKVFALRDELRQEHPGKM